MNVPLKKRYNYGKINESLSSGATNGNPVTADDSHNCGSHSNIDSRKQLLKDAPSMNLWRPIDKIHVDSGANQEQKKSSSCNMSSSASNHNPSTKYDTLDSQSTSSDDSSSTNNDTPNTSAQSVQRIKIYKRPLIELTQENLAQHERRFRTISWIDRVEYWELAETCSVLEDDFDDTTYYEKPVRSERVQKQLYKKRLSYAKNRPKRPKLNKVEQAPTPTPVEQPPIEVEQKLRSVARRPPTPMPRKSLAKQPTTSPVKQPIASQPPKSTKSFGGHTTKSLAQNTTKLPRTNKIGDGQMSFLMEIQMKRASMAKNKSIAKPTELVERLASDATQVEAIPSVIKCRRSYGKLTNDSKMTNGSRLDTSTETNLNESRDTNGVKKFNGNATGLSNGMDILPATSRDEFYSYLGIDTNPADKLLADATPCTKDANPLNNQRRSLRVFMQQRQMESITKSHDKLSKADADTAMAGKRKSLKSPCKSVKNLRVSRPSFEQQTSGGLGKRRRSEGFALTQHSRKIFKPDVMEPIKPAKSLILSRRTYKSTHNLTAAATNCDTQTTNETSAETVAPPAEPIPEPIEVAAAVNEPITDRLTEPIAGPSTTNANESMIEIIRDYPKRRILITNPVMLQEIVRRFRKHPPAKHLPNSLKLFRRFQQRRTVAAVNNRSDLNVASTSGSNVRHALPSIALRTIETQTDVPNVTVIPSLAIVQQQQFNGLHPPNTFSPTSITLSTASSDSAVVLNRPVNEQPKLPTIRMNASQSLQWYQDHVNDIDRAQCPNPLSPQNGAVLAILTHSIAANHNDCVVVVQESLVSYWFSPAKILGIFGIARTWLPIGQTERNCRNDEEVEALHQHRLIDIEGQFPVYVELRAREDRSDPLRQCCLTFMHLNVYSMKAINDQPMQLCMDSIQLDTLKGFVDTVSYIALRRLPAILMTWTELNVNNTTRCGIAKFVFKTPLMDTIEEIVDYPYIQKDIRTMLEINDDRIVGCGERVVAVFDHVTGDLLVHFEIDVPTIGRNLACFTCDIEDPELMLLIQLCLGSPDPNCDRQLKIMAVQIVHPFNWRNIQTHNIPNHYGKIQSIFNYGNDLMVITFSGVGDGSDGKMLLLNIVSPHIIHTRDICWTEPKKSISSAASRNGRRKTITADALPVQSFAAQCFAQANGQMIEINGDHLTTKAFTEYFIGQANKQIGE